jgi:hypothetical protein
VSKTQLTQFASSMKHLGIQMIAAYSPEARGRSERAAFLKGRGKMAVDNSCTRITGEENEHPPLTSCSQKTPF